MTNSERMVQKMMTQDDFNYQSFKKGIFELDIPMVDIISEEGSDQQSDDS